MKSELVTFSSPRSLAWELISDQSPSRIVSIFQSASWSWSGSARFSFFGWFVIAACNSAYFYLKRYSAQSPSGDFPIGLEGFSTSLKAFLLNLV